MKYHFFIISTFVAYMLMMTVFIFLNGLWVTPDQLVLLLLLGCLILKKTREFLLDWLPFLFILITYDFLRGLIPYVNMYVHFQELINADYFLFKTIPTIFLQSKLFDLNNLQWYDYLLTVFYYSHFILPLSFAYFLWSINKINFRKFTIALLFLSYSGWITYVLYPAAPPWLASQKGYIPEVHKIVYYTSDLLPRRIYIPTIYEKINANPVAAIPSLHAAYPMLVLLFSVYFFRLVGLFFIPYTFAVWFSLVYLGEHYVVDVLLGAIYAVLIFLLILLSYKHKLIQKITKIIWTA